ncbi:MAG: hypothetical protein AAF639_46880 [Chloroflexota bacterium]
MRNEDTQTLSHHEHTDDEEIVYKSRRPNPNEQRIIDLFDRFEAEAITSLEQGARQVIQLVTLFYGAVMGLVSLQPESIRTYVDNEAALMAALVLLLALAVAVLTATHVLMPLPYEYRAGSVDDREQAYARMIRRKDRSYRAALWAFGIGVAMMPVVIVAVVLF